MHGIRRAAARIRRGGLLRLSNTQERTSRRRALVTKELDLHTLRAANLGVVHSLLGDIPFLTGPSIARSAQRIAVAGSDRARVNAAVGSLDPHWIVHRGEDCLHLSPKYASPDGQIFTMPDLDIIVDFLERDSAGFHGREEGWVEYVDPQEWRDLTSGGASRGRVAQPPVSGFAPPIDIVYTWVDGSDRQWRRRREEALGAFNDPLHPTSVDDARFISTDELRYSLRSVFQFASWVRTVHIVTDSQIPAWLDTSHPKIRVVDHREILPQGVFNSHAIESALHRIPGLSEHYLYLNDDVFFGRIAHPQDYFFDNGIAKFFPSDLLVTPGRATSADLPIMAAAKNGRELIARRFQIAVHNKIRHSVHPQLRSVVEQINQDFPELFERMSHSFFRSPTDVSVATFLHHWYAFALGKAVPAEIEYLYLNITDASAWQALDALAALRRYDTFCLNQEEEAMTSGKAREEISQFLPQYFPFTAPWELGL